MYDVLRSFGSVLAFVLRFSGYLFFGFTSFALSNSLIKKLYSVDESGPNEEGSDPGNDGNFVADQQLSPTFD